MASKELVHVVEDDDAMRESLVAVLEDAGYEVLAYPNAEGFLAVVAATRTGCVVSDVRMPGMDGLTLLRRLRAKRSALPLVLITGHADVSLAVTAMKAGAVDFLEKPFEPENLLAAVEAALRAQASEIGEMEAEQAARRRLKRLTPREVEVFECLVAGKSNKEAAATLGLSPRTVEFHRAHIMEKTGAEGLPGLVRLWMAARASN
jgi:two-component system, LuxR family, response regulator FixJ